MVARDAASLSARPVVVQNARLFAGVLLLALLLGGCASFLPPTAALRDGLPQGLPPRVELTRVPFFPQEEYQCGPAALGGPHSAAVSETRVQILERSRSAAGRP
jgi:hypothetical protein